MRGLRLAMQFLTRIPVPGVADFSPLDLSRSAPWFPAVGLVVGAVVALVAFALGHRSPALGAVLGVLAWVWLTGAMHLDGLADLSDALGAAHRDPQRFLAVLADPHVGTFGIASIVLVLMLKAAALALGVAAGALWGVPLMLAWARLGTLAWSRWLPPLKAGHGERFTWQLSAGWVVFWTVLLLAASVALAPVLCAAPLVIAAWGLWLKVRLGGMSGDCLGAGVEVTETVLLVLVAVAPVGALL
jgi:adenosylcobinamide-GDP ribazoletransferase